MIVKRLHGMMAARLGVADAYCEFYSVLLDAFHRSDTSYEIISNDLWRVTTHCTYADITNIVATTSERLTGLSDSLRYEHLSYRDGILQIHRYASYDGATHTLTETTASPHAGTSAKRSRYGRTIETQSADGKRFYYYGAFGRVYYAPHRLHRNPLPILYRQTKNWYIVLQRRITKVVMRKLILDANMPPMLLKPWIDNLQAAGRYTFLRSEAVENSGMSPQALSRSLRKAERDGRIVKLKNYFYAIVPLEYRVAGSPPPPWFIDKLMEAIKQPYYVSLLTAASYHGAMLQQPQVFQLLTNKPVRPIVAGRTTVQFYASKYCAKAAVEKISTPAGVMTVSVPATTALDLVRFVNASGGLSMVASTIQSFADSIKKEVLANVLEQISDVPNTQRLGYIFDLLQFTDLATTVERWLKYRHRRLQPLQPGKCIANALPVEKWQLLVNTQLETE